ncbi:MAG: SMC-Scp complex subunit ScpB [Minisyncoccia bacterium]
MNLEMSIEAVLFYKTEPMKKTVLAELFSVSLEEVETALMLLSESLNTRGIRLVLTDTMAQLVTAPEASDIVDHVRKEELKSDIGKAGAETLSIILYRGPLSRVELDKIRGVNSSFILRNLLIRGLIERRAHPTDSRSFIYATTPALLNHLGVSKREELPEYEQILNALEQFEIQNVEDVPSNEIAS